MANNYIDDNNRGFASETRWKFFNAIIIVFVIIFVGRLAQLQILSDTQYSSRSKAQYIKKVKISPNRGNIYDRDGNLLVYNDIAFSITITPIDFKKYAIPLLTSITGLETSFIKKIVKENRGYNKFSQIKLVSNVDYSIVSQIEEYNDYLPGINVITDTKRVYDLPCRMAHIIGYTREVSKKQLKKMPYFKMGDVIGQSGIESSYNGILSGREGYKFYTVNNRGDKVDVFDTDRLNISPVNGSDIFLTLDLNLQKRAEQLLKGRRGAVVALNPNNGEVLALASAPDFEVEKFSGKIEEKYLASIYKNKDKPLFNRAIGAKYPPGSTWKMLIAIAGMEENIITQSSRILCVGGYDLGDRVLACHGAHGNIAVQDALKVSCNSYFGKLGVMLGIDKFIKWGHKFNFGKLTGIDIAGETKGLLPDKEYLQKRFGKYAFAKGRLANFGIGQGEILASPIQLAVFVSAIANGGKIIQPHIVSQIKDNFTGETYPIDYSITDLKLDKNELESIKTGMYRVVNAGGTGSAAYVSGKSVCGKTGTAQNPHGKSHALFVCFAPRKNPEIAIAIIVENAGGGGEVAAPIAREIMMRHFYPNWFAPKVDSLDFMINDSLSTIIFDE